MAAVSAQKMSDGKLVAATGKTRAEWHAILEAAGAQEWNHPTIAAWLQREHEVDGWWAQGITIGYEQAIGRRLPGQAADGTFSVSVTRTIDGTRATIVDPALAFLSKRLGEPATLAPDSVYTTARWKANGESTAAAISEPKPGKTTISLTRSKIVDGEKLDVAKQELARALDDFAVSDGRIRVG